MAKKLTKKRKAVEGKVDPDKLYALTEAMALVKEVNTTKFNHVKPTKPSAALFHCHTAPVKPSVYWFSAQLTKQKKPKLPEQIT
jgi:hypothetical protein